MKRQLFGDQNTDLYVRDPYNSRTPFGHGQLGQRVMNAVAFGPVHGKEIDDTSAAQMLNKIPLGKRIRVLGTISYRLLM